MTVPLGEGKGGALQARCKGGAASAQLSKSDRKVVTIGIMKNLTITNAHASNSYASLDVKPVILPRAFSH